MMEITKRYRIRETIEATQNGQEQIWALIVWRLRISHTTLYRKVDSDIGSEGPKYEFTPAELQAIQKIFKEFDIPDINLVQDTVSV